MPTPGFGLIVVGIVVMAIGLFVYAGCSGTELLFLGAGLLLVGLGIALSGGVTALYLIGPIGAIMLVLGLVFRATGSC